MGVEIAIATIVGNQCMNRGKVRSISDKIEVMESIHLLENHRNVAKHNLRLSQAREENME